MFSRSITLFFTTITIFFSAVTGQIGQNREFGNCTTPNKVEGKCVYLAECMQLADLVQRVDLSDHQTQLLRDSQCGYHGKHPLVCCPPRNDVLPDSDGCAVALRDRVHGGNLTRIDDYPWMALLEYKKRTNNEIQYLCGGALINPRYILTAAHCIKAPAISDNYTLTGVRLGEWDLSTTIDCEADDCNDPPVDVGVEEIITHENYNPSAKNQLHDIAVLRLEREVRFTHWIRPICLPKAAHLHGDLQNIATTISGWGKTETGFSSNKKLRATVTCVSLEDCNRIYSGFAVSLQETQLCAGGSIGVDSCNGDSGGPLVAIDKTTERYYFYAAGIVSFGPNPCAQKGWPGVYTKVSKYIGWIQSKLQP